MSNDEKNIEIVSGNGDDLKGVTFASSFSI